MSFFDRPEKANKSNFENEVIDTDSIYLKIPIDMIRPDPNQPRTTIVQEDIDKKQQQLERMGQLSPIRVFEMVFDKETGEKYYPLEDGECRWRACKQSNDPKLKFLDAKIISRNDNIDEKEQEYLKLIRQLQSNDDGQIKMTLSDRASAYLRAKELKGSNRAAAQDLGVSEDTFSRVLAVNKLPEEILFAAKRFDIEDPKILNTLKVVHADDEQSFDEVVKAIDNTKKSGKGSIRETVTNAVKKTKSKKSQKKNPKPRAVQIKDLNIIKGEKNYILEIVRGRTIERFVLDEALREKLK